MSEEDKNEHKLKPLDLNFGEILKIVEADFGDYRKAYEIEKYIKRCFRVACEFYLKYKDEPELLFEEKREYRVILAHLFGDEKDTSRYNEWLFKLAFKSILDEELKVYNE